MLLDRDIVSHLQSMRRACPSLAMTDTNWSMIPHLLPAYLCSLSWQSRAFSTGPRELAPMYIIELHTGTVRDDL